MQKPNIIVMTTHDTGRHLGCYGVPSVHSPHIDRFAADGVRFAQSFCNAPQCSPSRAALFTGRYPHSNGVMGLTHYPFYWDLHETERHLADRLREVGYRTAVMGHAHESRTIAERGFGDVLQPGPNAEARVDAALSYIDSAGDEPFFLEVNHFETHRARIGFGSPPDVEDGVYVPPYLQDTVEAREDFALFQGSVRAYDAAVGRLLEGLAARGRADSTFVVLTTDHGIPFPRAKCSLYDPGLEAYLLMRWPEGGIDGGRVIESPVTHVDFVPTILALLGISGDDTIQGTSYADLLRGDRSAGAAAAERPIFGEMTFHDYCDPRRCVRTAQHKLIVNFTTAHEFMDPSQSWHRKTITKSPEHPPYAYHEPVELYDLTKDPWEAQNVAGLPEYAQVRRDLLQRLHTFLVETEDPILEGVPNSPMHSFAMQAFVGAEGFPFDRTIDHSWMR